MASQVVVSAEIPEKLRDDAMRCFADEGRTFESALREFLERTVLLHSAPEGTECTPEEHDAWFRAQVQEALDDPGPYLTQEEVEAHMTALRAQYRGQHVEKA